MSGAAAVTGKMNEGKGCCRRLSRLTVFLSLSCGGIDHQGSFSLSTSLVNSPTDEKQTLPL